MTTHCIFFFVYVIIIIIIRLFVEKHSCEKLDFVMNKNLTREHFQESIQV